jgi:release factor glutamine methyltransferase
MQEHELVFTRLLGCSRPHLYLQRGMRLGREQSRAVAAVLRRRIAGEPLDYILGSTEFMGHEFKVTPGVLIPRQETELLVEAVLQCVACQPRSSSLEILDLGTGSGCIAISLAKALPHAKVTAVDISGHALEVARCNARALSAEVAFVESDLCCNEKVREKRYDYIVANPPYIPRKEISRLQPEIGFEPRIALDAGADGLDFYRRITADAPGVLNEGGRLFMEIGFNQSGSVKNIIQKSGNFEIIEIIRDYGGIDRVIACRKHSP